VTSGRSSWAAAISPRSKVEELRELGALVTVVTDAPSPEIGRLAAAGAVTLIARPYRDGDLAGAWLGFAAAGDPAVHARVRDEADRERIWLNAVDDVPNCSFIAGSVHRVGDVVVSVTTSGACPALAVRLRQTIARLVGPEHGRFTRLGRQVPPPGGAPDSDFETRRRFWYSVVDSPALGLFRQGTRSRGRRRFHELLRAAESGEAPASGGRVILVGAGPGDPGLITAGGLAWLRNRRRRDSRSARPSHALARGPAGCRADRRGQGAARTGYEPGADPRAPGRARERRQSSWSGSKAATRSSSGAARRKCRARGRRDSNDGHLGGDFRDRGPAAAGIPVTRRGVAGGFAVVTGHDAATPRRSIGLRSPRCRRSSF